MKKIFLFNEYVSEQLRKDTIKLLRHIRITYGIDTYILTKKFFLIALIIHYFQSKHKYEIWVSFYSIFLRFKHKPNYAEQRQLFFGFNITQIKSSTIQELQNIVIKRAEQEIINSIGHI